MFKNKFFDPIRDVFKLLDVKESGVVPRLDFVKSLRNYTIKFKLKSKEFNLI
jgi:Ca2+-binding EF-hand superfamily protein